MTTNENQPEAEEVRVEVSKAIEPFATFARDHVDDDGWISGSGRERICDWFGPSDFRDARSALERGQTATLPVPGHERSGGRTEQNLLPEGYVLAPVDDGPNFSNSGLPYRMIAAGMEILEKADDDGAGRNGVDVPDWDYGMIAVAVYRAMLAAVEAEPAS